MASTNAALKTLNAENNCSKNALQQDWVLHDKLNPDSPRQNSGLYYLCRLKTV